MIDFSDRRREPSPLLAGLPARLCMAMVCLACLSACPCEHTIAESTPADDSPPAEEAHGNEDVSGGEQAAAREETTRTAQAGLSQEELAHLRSVGREPMSASGSEDAPPDTTEASDERQPARAATRRPCPSCGAPGGHDHRHQQHEAPSIFDPREELLGSWRAMELPGDEPGTTVVPDIETLVELEADGYRIRRQDEVERFDFEIKRIVGRRVTAVTSHDEAVITMRFMGRDHLRITDEEDRTVMVLTR